MSTTLTEVEMQHLLALRSSAVRKAPSPPVPMDVALRLVGHGLAHTDGVGGISITDAGVRFLEPYFLFCNATGCDGILRRWRYFPGGRYGGCHPDDPDIQHNKAGGFYIKCGKCGSINMLEGTEHPQTIGDHRVTNVFKTQE
jgi:hypothetical protein